VAQKLLVLLDCCHAGGLSDLKALGLQFAKAPLPPEAQGLLAQGRGRVIIASSREDERSFAGKPYSAFTRALIEALCGRGVSKKDGYVRVADLALYAGKRVPQLTKDRQHPILNLEQADNFVLAYYAGGAKQPKALPLAQEPEIEPEPGAWTVFDQRGQIVYGPQTDIAGGVSGPVLSGIFEAPVIFQPAEAAMTALHQIPAPPADFTGREEELRDILTNFDRGATISGLRGMGGIGKTALALKLAERLKGRYPDAQLFLDLRGISPKPLTPAEAMAQVIHAYHPTARLPEDQNELRALYCSVLHGQRALLLLDNAASREQVEPLLPPPTCAVLITSRQKFALPGLKPKDLDILPPADARALLLAIAERIGDHADELARLCGCLPLALRNAASVLAERVDLSPSEYARRLMEAKMRLELVEASFSLSYDLLPSEQRARWCTLSVFPADFDRAGAAAVWGMDFDPAAEALSELVKWSLVEYAPTPGPSSASRGVGEGVGAGRYRLHDLARLFADSRLAPAARGAAQQRHAAHYESVYRAATELYKQGGDNILPGLALFDTEWGNIQAGQSWAKANMETNDTAASLCSAYVDEPYLLDLRQHPRQRIRWLEAGLAAARRLKDRGAEGADLGNLGNAYFALGETRRAIEFHEQALEIDREVGDRQGEGADLGNLGNAYFALGETRRAIEFYEQHLVITREIGDRRGEGNVLGNLGSAYFSLGEVRRAMDYYGQQLAITREVGDRRGEGNALQGLGISCSSLGDTRQAIAYYEQQLVIVREIGDRRGEGSALGNLGLAYADLGETRRAIEFYEQQLVITREIGDRRGEGAALGNLGIAYKNLGETRRAIEFYEQALAIDREIGDRRGEGNALGNLGLAYAALGEARRAIEFYEQALVIDREIGDRRGEGADLGNLGSAYFTLGEARRAIEFYE
jgi:tetratricopeptide (TPR) repeat protein